LYGAWQILGGLSPSIPEESQAGRLHLWGEGEQGHLASPFGAQLLLVGGVCGSGFLFLLISWVEATESPRIESSLVGYRGKRPHARCLYKSRAP
jgi:hypothetical protein